MGVGVVVQAVAGLGRAGMDARVAVVRIAADRVAVPVGVRGLAALAGDPAPQVGLPGRQVGLELLDRLLVLLDPDRAVGVLGEAATDLRVPGVDAGDPGLRVQGVGDRLHRIDIDGAPGGVGGQRHEGSLLEQPPGVGVALDRVQAVGGDIEQVVEVPGHHQQVPGGVLVDVEVVGAAPVPVVIA